MQIPIVKKILFLTLLLNSCLISHARKKIDGILEFKIGQYTLTDFAKSERQKRYGEDISQFSHTIEGYVYDSLISPKMIRLSFFNDTLYSITIAEPERAFIRGIKKKYGRPKPQIIKIKTECEKHPYNIAKTTTWYNDAIIADYDSTWIYSYCTLDLIEKFDVTDMDIWARIRELKKLDK